MSFYDLFRRIFNVGKGKATQAVSALENQNLDALIAVEEEKMRKAEGDFNIGLKKNAGVVEALRSTKERLETEIKETKVKLDLHIKAGNTTKAQELVLKMQEKKQQLTKVTDDFAHAEKQEKDLIKVRDAAVKAARENISKIKQNLVTMRQQESLAQLQEAASGMVTDIGGTGDTINRVAEIVERRKNEAVGAARIARTNIDTSDIDMSEQEKSALANAALAEYMAENNISAPSQEKPVDAPKQMGPGTIAATA
jgi:hypothetical protein